MSRTREVGTLRVAVADDSALVRAAVVAVLERHGVSVVAEADDGEALLAAVDRHAPDAAVVDLRMPPTHNDEGIRTAQVLGERHPGVGVLLLSQYLEASYAIRLVEQRPAGAGYLLKDQAADVTKLVRAVRTVAEGGTFVDPAVVDALLTRRPGADPGIDELTARERDVLGLMAEGRSNAGICAALYLSPKTVESHVGRIFAKLGIPSDAGDHRRVLAVLRYLDAGSSRARPGLG